MFAMQVGRFGGPEVFERSQADGREPGYGEVAVRVEAAGINFADILARMGLYPDVGKPPFVPGLDFSGIVESVGEGVQDLHPGQAVFGMRQHGCYTQRLVTLAPMVFPRPASLDAVAAAAAPLIYLTAWHSLVRVGGLREGERVLIHNAGGGLGTAAVQIARHVGAVVLGTASPAKHERLRQMGVTDPIDYRRADWTGEVDRLTDGQGVALILDPLGGRTLKEGFDLLSHTGRLVSVGISSWAPGRRRRLLKALWRYLRTPRFSPVRMMQKNRGVIGVHIGHLGHRIDMLRGEVLEMLPLFSSGVLSPVVDSVFPLSEAGAAHEYIQGRNNFGKVVLRTGGA